MPGRFERFTVLISEIARRIHRIKTAEMEEFGLRGSHVSCLYYLARFGPMSAGELCERCGEDKANVSRTVAELRKKGMLTYSATGKRYQSPLELTDADWKYLSKITWPDGTWASAWRKRRTTCWRAWAADCPKRTGRRCTAG